MEHLHHQKKGFTLIEITLVISLILGLITILVLGTKAYKDGSDRARCIMSMTQLNKTMIGIMSQVELSTLDDQVIRVQISQEMNKIYPTTWMSHGASHSGMIVHMPTCNYEESQAYAYKDTDGYYMTAFRLPYINSFKPISIITPLNGRYYAAIQCRRTLLVTNSKMRHSVGLNN